MVVNDNKLIVCFIFFLNKKNETSSVASSKVTGVRQCVRQRLNTESLCASVHVSTRTTHARRQTNVAISIYPAVPTSSPSPAARHLGVHPGCKNVAARLQLSARLGKSKSQRAVQ
jgi:hypothetical protein